MEVLSALLFFAVLCFILLSGGGLSAILFGAAAVVSLLLVLHYARSCLRMDAASDGGKLAAFKVLAVSVIFTRLMSWKLYALGDRLHECIFLFLAASAQLASFIVCIVCTGAVPPVDVSPC
uniref:Uncharacterized protein n=1 Tax=Arundo donax TaxID=35708 RepID=A0A0A9F4I2_ARUDO